MKVITINKLDTKSKIFSASLRLFATNGYENVSMRNIADAVGIQVASIYYHYRNKEEILEDCYTFYVAHRYESRLTKDQYEPIVKNGSKEEILMFLLYAYPANILVQMNRCFFTILSRIYCDSRALAIYLEEINGSLQYTSEVFQFGIEAGRFHEFHIQNVSLLFISAGLFVAQYAAVNPDELTTLRDMRVNMYDEVLALIPFKY